MNQSLAKLANKNKQKVNTQATTHKEKYKSFVSMRKSMMNNWGTKW
jgi:hypothetical protein